MSKAIWNALISVGALAALASMMFATFDKNWPKAIFFFCWRTTYCGGRMTPLDRAALADALASASPETLREWAMVSHSRAELVRELAEGTGVPGPVLVPEYVRKDIEMHRGIAALLLAVAAMQERGFGVDAAWFGPDDPPVWFDTDTRPDEDSGVNTIMAALAALLKGDQ